MGFLWQKLNVRLLRYWATKKKTERWNVQGSNQNIVDRSRKNIAWHGFLTLIFAFLMIRAQFTDIVFLQYASLLLLIPSIVYFLGSIVQRQKIVIILNRKRKGVI